MHQAGLELAPDWEHLTSHNYIQMKGQSTVNNMGL